MALKTNDLVEFAPCHYRELYGDLLNSISTRLFVEIRSETTHRLRVAFHLVSPYTRASVPLLHLRRADAHRRTSHCVAEIDDRKNGVVRGLKKLFVQMFINSAAFAEDKFN
eukprot:5823097-Pleurochrysis_carterae.AAC.2